MQSDGANQHPAAGDHSDGRDNLLVCHTSRWLLSHCPPVLGLCCHCELKVQHSPITQQEIKGSAWNQKPEGLGVEGETDETLDGGCQGDRILQVLCRALLHVEDQVIVYQRPILSEGCLRLRPHRVVIGRLCCHTKLEGHSDPKWGRWIKKITVIRQ